LRSAIEGFCGIPVVGSLPRSEELNIAERHLGLKPFSEGIETPKIDSISRYIENHLDLDEILKIAARAWELDRIELPALINPGKQVKMGVIRDRVFSFYYPENLEALERAGAEIVFINSLQDQRLPDIDALYVGGGFPELFLPELEANRSLRKDIAWAIENYLPVYAECAGLMYLCNHIAWQGEVHEMVGVIDAEAELCSKPQGHGYVQIEVTDENPFFPRGLTFWGHEFHHSRLVSAKETKTVFKALRWQGMGGGRDGIVYKNVLATYAHLHALGVPQWAEGFCKLALGHKQKSGVLRGTKI
jgi:cobyrinic acid a,c-diamide synthase